MILVLDDSLQQLPFESLPCLRSNTQVSRMPSLVQLFVRVRGSGFASPSKSTNKGFVLLTGLFRSLLYTCVGQVLQLRFPNDPSQALTFLKECLDGVAPGTVMADSDHLTVNTADWSYIINPGSDLSNTEKRLRPLLDTKTSNPDGHSCGVGFIGKAPTNDEFASLLQVRCVLFSLAAWHVLLFVVGIATAATCLAFEIMLLHVKNSGLWSPLVFGTQRRRTVCWHAPAPADPQPRNDIAYWLQQWYEKTPI